MSIGTMEWLVYIIYMYYSHQSRNVTFTSTTQNISERDFSLRRLNWQISYNQMRKLLPIIYVPKALYFTLVSPASVAQFDAPSDWRPGVADSIPAEVGNILSWIMIMKYFLLSFFSFR